MTESRGGNEPRRRYGSVSLEQVEAAIDKSGYPLQFVVGNLLGSEFAVEAEWGYLDRNTEEMRAIDLMATRFLHKWDYPHSDRVYPRLSLLIECKRSELPYVFFSGNVRRGGGSFPHVAGLHQPVVRLSTDGTMDRFSFPVLDALGLGDHEFLSTPGGCTTLSKCAFVKGGDVILSGAEPYNDLVLPIRSAVEYYRETRKALPMHQYFTPTLVVGVAVLQAPMFAAEIDSDGATSIRETKWQRLWRHEPLPGKISRPGGEASAIDVVHRDFLAEYVDAYLMPFARTFCERALRHDEVLATGVGYAAGLRRGSRSNPEPGLRPTRRRPAPGAVRSTGPTHAWGDARRAVIAGLAEAVRARRKPR